MWDIIVRYNLRQARDPEGNAVPGITPDIILLSETYSYTSLNQIDTVTVNVGGFSKSYRYTYYPNGLIETYTNPEGVTYTYYYNKNNQLTAVHIPDQGQLTYSNFTWLMPQTLLLPGGNRISLTYNDFLQVEERILKDPANNTVAGAIYAYDLESNIQQIISEQGTYSFAYDNLYRLTQAEYPAGVAANDEVFVYDGVGNRTEHSVGSLEENNNSIVNLGYNEHNQLIERTTQSGTTTFTYNANGHTATTTENGSTTEYSYNHEERLIAVRINGQIVAEYAYNPQGQRIRKIAGGQTTYYVYNQHGLAAEYDASGNLIKEYHFHPQKTWMTDPLFQRTANNIIYYYQNDHLGTPQRLLSNTGAVVWQANYSAFGEAEILINTVENNLRFPGQYFDAETNLHQNYFRDYDPSIGRYIQSDPIGLAGGLNMYTYAYQNSLIKYDPHGQAVFVLPLVPAAAKAVNVVITLAAITWIATWEKPHMPGGIIPIDPNNPVIPGHVPSSDTYPETLCPPPSGGGGNQDPRSRCINGAKLELSACIGFNRPISVCYARFLFQMIACSARSGDGD